MPARVRMGARYTYRPALIDLIDPKTTLVPGEPVRVIRPHGCPPPNTMGHCHVADMSGKFRGLVLTNSLQREST
jgi:hypothetical protein